MAKYNKVIKCDLKDGKRTWEDCILLLQSERKFTNFDVDLTGDLFFNELDIENIQEEIEVNSLNDIYGYCKINDVSIPKEYITENGLICGGEKDFIINDNLIGGWMEE